MGWTLATVFVQDEWFVGKDSLVMHVFDQGSWVRDLYNLLSLSDQHQTLNRQLCDMRYC